MKQDSQVGSTGGIIRRRILVLSVHIIAGERILESMGEKNGY